MLPTTHPALASFTVAPHEPVIVTPIAVDLPMVDRCDSHGTIRILGCSHRFEVARVDASAVTAEMIDI